jgi:hypothetical protein
MKQLIESGAVRMGAVIQNVCANVDFDVLSLPGGSLIAILLWIYASAGVPRLCCAARLPRGQRISERSRSPMVVVPERDESSRGRPAQSS